MSELMSQLTQLLCHCEGHCPGNVHNGTCVAKAGSVCFTAVEEVYNPESRALELETTYGCLPPDEKTVMQCKGHLVPHSIPKSILCCNEYDKCNLDLRPKHFVTPTPTIGEPVFAIDNDRTHLLAYCLTIVSIFILIYFLYLAFKRYRRRHNTENNLSFYDETHNLCAKNEKSDILMKVSADQSVSSGSGSGMPLLVQRTIGKQIEFVKSIGKGRYGEVWKANWRQEQVAVKIFFTTEESSWYRETNIYQTVLLRHPNILGFVAADIRGTGSVTQMLLITDYHENGSLYDYLKNRKFPLSASECVVLAHSAICGICHLHTEIFGKQGKPAIAHRDIKSKNILVKSDGTCAIADLNLALRYDSNEKLFDISPNVKVGTKRYMAPEILDDSILYDHFESYKMADMYSFGLVMWEIARRTAINGVAEEYIVPYAEYVPNDPTFEDMKKVVCLQSLRPTLSLRWNTDSVVNQLTKIMQECWHEMPCARLTSLRVKKSLARLYWPQIKEC